MGATTRPCGQMVEAPLAVSLASALCLGWWVVFSFFVFIFLFLLFCVCCVCVCVCVLCVFFIFLFFFLSVWFRGVGSVGGVGF